MSKVSKARQEEAKAALLEILKPGDTVHTILRHRSGSGMFRRISLVKIEPTPNRPDGIYHMDVLAADALGEGGKKRDGSWRVENGEGIPTSGCGMDMGFHLVSTLSRVLFPEGFGCIGEGCPSNDHSNGDRSYTVHGSGVTSGELAGISGVTVKHWHSAGDYALRQSWI